jgi:polyphosphate kinase
MSERMINRELSWLEFNRRVLEEAQDPTVPLLERVKFLSIFSSNLDEFFMVRVADLKQRIWVGDQSAAADGLSPSQTLAAVSERVHALVQEQHRCFLADIQPRLVAEGIRIVRPKEATPEQIEVLDEYFSRTLLPVVTPLAIDPGHPFPHLVNRALCLIVSLRPTVPSVLPSASLAVIHIPAQVIPRFIRLPSAPGEHSFMLLEDVIRLNLHRLYHGYEILSAHAIRVTRDADVPLTGGRSADDLLKAIEESLRERRMGDAVRLQYDPDLPPEVLARLVEELELEPGDLYPGEGFTAFTDLGQLYAAVDLPRLKDRPLVPHPVRAVESAPDVWSAIREGDILVHHPYQPFDVVTRFVQEAGTDPKVLAINMTLYRVSPTSPIAKALTLAAQAGKEVAVLVELRARFDEEANIRWAQALEEVGAHVVYGIPGYKTHCKACLIVRQEPDGIRRYCHLSTGNYNARTGAIYADLGLFTCREAFGEDLTELFNLLTGYTRPVRFNHLLVAPIGLRNALVEKIRREAAHARAGRPARIVAKVNSLVDWPIIQELYEASQSGVRIDLLVRGTCCLRPGVPGLSERIKVVSIVDRFLEHARIYYFENGSAPEYYLASADWMPRNLDHRVETAFPILDPELQAEIREVLEVQLQDTAKARLLQPDGTSVRARPTGGIGDGLRSQDRIYELIGARRD